MTLRPAAGQLLTNTKWVLEQKLVEGGFGEVWLGRHQTMKERRGFKFCFRADRVRSLEREMTWSPDSHPTRQRRNRHLESTRDRARAGRVGIEAMIAHHREIIHATWGFQASRPVAVVQKRGAQSVANLSS